MIPAAPALLFALAAPLVWAQTALPLSAFGLTPQALERLGFNDSQQGLLEISAARWYAGSQREAKLRELAARTAVPVAQPPRPEPRVALPALELRLPERNVNGALDLWFDNSSARGGVGAVTAQATGNAAAATLPRSEPREATAQREPPAVLLSAGGLQSRGGAAELARLVASKLPGGGASDLAAAGAEAVKAEGGREILEQVRAIIAAGIPYCGHLGMLPQHVIEEGGYHRKGRTASERENLLADAQALADTGAFALVLEIVIPQVAKEITENIPIPTLGIGSGPDCDGQILVTHDLIGTFPWFTPKFVKPKLNAAEQMSAAIREWKKSL